MVLLFQRKDSALSEESKRFLNSLPSTFINLFRKRRQLLPVWSSHKYCAMIKSTYLVYYRATKPEDAGVPGFWQQHTLKYLNLQNCKIKLIDDDSAGYVFCITPESGRGAIYFAADTDKDRAKFASQAAAVQHRLPSLSEFTTLKLLGRGHYGRVILASYSADRQLYAIKEMKLGQVKAKFGCILFELRAGYPPFYLPQSSQKSTHQRILYQPVRYPNNMSPELKSLLVALLEKRQDDRLGARGGIADIKAHEFFAGIDWDLVLKRQLKPPLVPGPPGENFVANFDPHFTEQPHTIYAPEEIASCFERDFAGFDYVRQLSAGVCTGRSSMIPSAKMSASSASTVSSRSSFKDASEDFESSGAPVNQDQQSTCEDDKPEVELEAELEVDSVRIKI
ncbi:hypothetical protein PF001_g17219 [Phytophthora fragariae]|uniref:AGC-kinase C-terminal domain-containing protein n=1 Tax=Phytophthora fragariae TaxID=53985 RepID=A0A6A4CSU3_9STRA|nr:hypothetical protein PF004_g1038 [Phytophthora fragariae]KAE9295685.1 hypothetical protein PF001_g17219 [Phytophthora fragariae]